MAKDKVDTSVTALETAWGKLTNVRTASGETSNERNRYTREAYLASAETLNHKTKTVMDIINGFRAVGGNDPWTEKDTRAERSTASKVASQWRLIETVVATKAGLEKLCECWPDGRTVNDDKSVSYKVTLNAEQFFDAARRIKDGKSDNMSGEEINSEIREGAKAKQKAKRVAADPKTASAEDLQGQLVALCTAYLARFPRKVGSREALNLMTVLLPEETVETDTAPATEKAA